MAKVTLNETPSEMVTAKVNLEFTIIDDKGRSIIIKKPSVLAQYDLISVVGAERAKNEVWMSLVLPLMFVVSIDGEAAHVGTYAEVRALIQRLDEDGIVAVQKGVEEHFGQSNPDADKAALKN